MTGLSRSAPVNSVKVQTRHVTMYACGFRIHPETLSRVAESVCTASRLHLPGESSSDSLISLSQRCLVRDRSTSSTSHGYSRIQHQRRQQRRSDPPLVDQLAPLRLDVSPPHSPRTLPVPIQRSRRPHRLESPLETGRHEQVHRLCWVQTPLGRREGQGMARWDLGRWRTRRCARQGRLGERGA